MRTTHLLFFGLGLSISTVCLCQPVPPNDNFADRIVLSGNFITFSGTLAGATVESEEPDLYYSADHSVWWSWTAQESAAVTIDVLERPGSYRNDFGVFTGTNMTALTNADYNYNLMDYPD